MNGCLVFMLVLVVLQLIGKIFEKGLETNVGKEANWLVGCFVIVVTIEV